MKTLTLTLLLANLAVAGFFLGRDYLPLTHHPQHAPLNIDRIALGSRPQRAAPITDDKVPASRCVAWSNFDANTFEQAREQLIGLVNERPLSFIEVPTEVRSWVVFPPLPSVQAAHLKMQEFAALGVADVGIVKDGAWRNGISLGLYGNPESADKRIAQLEAKGILGVRIEKLPRPGTGYSFIIKSSDDLSTTLAALRAAYPGSRQGEIECPI